MSTTPSRRVDAVLFDKDGTLFDFGATWNVWGGRILADLAGGDADLLRALSAVTRYDLAERRFLPDSHVIGCTNLEVAELIASVLPQSDVPSLEAYLTACAAEAPLVPTVPLDPLLAGLAGQGLKLGLMTNDTEVSARAHLGSAGVVGRFHFIAGFDSGHGAKPAPGPLLAFARAMDLPPQRVVMVGDSAHDLLAGRAAGMACVGVLTGPATRYDLAPLADAVLPDIGHLPDWIGL